jgi:hypothetical protein
MTTKHAIARRLAAFGIGLGLAAGPMTSSPAPAQGAVDRKAVERTVSRGGSVVVMRMANTSWCGAPAVSGTVFGRPQYGTVTVKTSTEKLRPGGAAAEGFRHCNKDVGITEVLYTAGGASGRDEFSVRFRFGRGYDQRNFIVTVR